jgi:MFS family permease
VPSVSASPSQKDRSAFTFRSEGFTLHAFVISSTRPFSLQLYYIIILCSYWSATYLGVILTLPEERSHSLMPQPAKPQRADDDERTPLILVQPPTGERDRGINGPADARNTDNDVSQSITTLRTVFSALALGGLIFLQSTNISILTTTQSAIAGDLDAFEKTSWFTSAYLIAMSALGPLNGKLAAVFTPRLTIFASTVLLAIGTITSGLANDFTGFIAGRVLTGVGASGIFTISIIIVLELTSAKQRGLAIGLLNSGFTVGVAVGATAAGALLPVVGWRWLFLGQAPIALLGGVVLLLSIPSTFTTGKQDDSKVPTPTRLAKLDYIGAITLTASIVLVLYSLGAPRHIPLLPLVLSPFVFATFILNEVYVSTDPIIPISLLKSRGLLLTCLATVGYMMARWAVLFYTPTYAIAVRNWSPASAGAILVPTNAGFALGGLLVGGLHIRRSGSFYVPTLVVYIFFPFTMVLLAMLSTHDSNKWLYVLDVLVSGALTGAALNYNLAHVLHLTPKNTHYVATSLLATFRGFSGSFGSAIGGGMFSRTLYNSLTRQFAERGIKNEELVIRLLGSPALVGSLEGVQKEVAVKGYEEALKMLFLSGAGLAALMVFVQAGTGWKGAGEECAQAANEEEREEPIDGAENAA